MLRIGSKILLDFFAFDGQSKSLDSSVLSAISQFKNSIKVSSLRRAFRGPHPPESLLGFFTDYI